MTPTRRSVTTRAQPFNSILLVISSCVAIAVIFLLLLASGGDGDDHNQNPQRSIVTDDNNSDFSIGGISAMKMNSISNSRNMVGGYSTLDAKVFMNDSEITNIAKFAFREFITSPSSPAFTATATKITGGSQEVDSSSSSSSSSIAFMATPEELEGGMVKIQVLEAQTQVVAGLNYKFTLAILEENHSSVCRGFLRGITVYKPLPHTGQGLSVTSWGKPLDCSDTELMKLLQENNDNDNAMMKEKEEEEQEQEGAKENALVVEENLEKEVEEVEPDT